MANTNTTIKTAKAHKYYFVEVYYHDLTTKRDDETRMSEYGEVVHGENGAYWLVAGRTKKQVSAALCGLGYALVSVDKKPR